MRTSLSSTVFPMASLVNPTRADISGGRLAWLSWTPNRSSSRARPRDEPKALMPESSPEMLFRPPPRRAPPLEAPFELDMLPELLHPETTEGMASAVRMSTSASSSRKPSSRRGIVPEPSPTKSKRKVATHKHAKSQLMHDPAADDALLESLRHEHGLDDDYNDPTVDIGSGGAGMRYVGP